MMESEAHLSVMENATRSDISGYEGIVTFKNPVTLWSENWFGVVLEFGVFALFIQTCVHASRRGEKSMFLIIALMVAAIGIELLQQIPHEGYELWWYHESTINLMRHKVPLYISCMFSVIYYYTDYMNKNVNLPVLTQSLVNACSAMLLTLPCLTLAHNLLLMVFHTDDAVFRDRVFNVPLSQIFYLFVLYFHVGHLYNTLFDQIEAQEWHFFRLLRCSLQTGVVSAIYSLIEFYLLYVTFKFIVTLNVAVCLLSAIVVLGCMAKDEINEEVKTISFEGFVKTLMRKEWIYLISAFLVLSFVPMMVNPEGLKSTGDRQEFGPCDVIHAISNMSPLFVYRKKYVCINDTEKFGFDFHCAPELRTETGVKKNFTICGVPFSNIQVEHLLGYSAMCLAAFYFVFSLKVTKHERQVPEKAKKLQ